MEELNVDQEEVMENVEDVITTFGSKDALKVVAGAGLAVIGSYAIYKGVKFANRKFIKPAINKFKASKESEGVTESDGCETSED